MELWRRILYRASVLTERWAHQNAFFIGLVFGGSLTLAVVLVHLG